jgi:ribosome maturation factor RimP
MSASTSLKQRLHELLTPVVEGLGYELVHLELSGKGGVLCVFIDHWPANGHAGREVTVEDCERVSREVEAALDVEDPIPGSYHLEVSSPGLDRPLVKAAHFRRFLGHQARVTLEAPIDGRRRFRGEIAGADDETVVLNVEGEPVQLPLEDIRKARLVPEFD